MSNGNKSSKLKSTNEFQLLLELFEVNLFCQDAGAFDAINNPFLLI